MSIDPKRLLELIDLDEFKAEALRRGFDLIALPEARRCAYCQAVIVGATTNQRYCSPEHRRRAALKRAISRPPELSVAAREAARKATWTEEQRAAHNAYHRQYQRDYRRRMTAEQKERHRAQQRASKRRIAAQERAA